ncbi:hypothetical protein NQ176_g2364 [Zarea fungicola]|uniref:Uncharacterized protein n=1 Tax=Zarea fungicola TaxID=93591 RepID=A0ACC1NQL6_9HYPO|nr:hypothetical protein NQ176_g2364 [Lecanicillium fungicola]
MHFLSLTMLFGLVASNAVPNLMPIFERGEGLNITQEEAHENVLASIPAEYIVHSDDLEADIAKNRDANHTIYLSDEGAFVNLASIEYAAPRELQNRESGPCIAPLHFTKTYTKQAGQWYDA